MHHLRGVAPQMSPYRCSPFPAFYRPILTGLWPPSRSFDRGIAPVADASRTLCAGIPAIRNPCSFAAALVVPPWLEARCERASLRSAPASSSLTVQPMGWGTLRRPWWRGVHRDGCREAERRDRDEAGSTQTLLSSWRSIFWRFSGAVDARASDAGAFRRLCSDPVRIRRAHLAMHPRGCRHLPSPCGADTHQKAG